MKLIPYENGTKLPTFIPRPLTKLPETNHVEPFQIAPVAILFTIFVGLEGVVQLNPSTDVVTVPVVQSPVAMNCAPFHSTLRPVPVIFAGLNGADQLIKFDETTIEPVSH